MVPSLPHRQAVCKRGQTDEQRERGEGKVGGPGAGGERGKGGEGSCAISLPLRPFLLRLFLWLGSCSRNLLSLAAK